MTQEPHTRRRFLVNAAATAAAATATASVVPRHVLGENQLPPSEMKNRNYKDVRTAAAVLGESQVNFRLGLARQRTRTYPLDSMDFIMMDLERRTTTTGTRTGARAT